VYEYEEEHRLVIPSKQSNARLFRRHFLKWLGALSTALIAAAALAPSAFRIPTDLQPWVFLTSIFWYLVFCAGLFDL
jgi:hypothetical protein